MNTWTTEKPKEPGFYYVYGVLYRYAGYTEEQQPSKLDLVEISNNSGLDYDKDELYIWEGTNGETRVSSCGYTHWMKVQMPLPP
jgi:hypothetical protein